MTSNAINRSKITLRPHKDYDKPLKLCIECREQDSSIDSADFVCSGSCMEAYTSSGIYLNTSKGVWLEEDTNYPPKTFIILQSFDKPLNKFYVKVFH